MTDQPGKSSSDSASAEKYTAAGWKERFRHFEAASPHEIAGALYDAPADKLLTENQVRQALKTYRGIKQDYSDAEPAAGGDEE